MAAAEPRDAAIIEVLLQAGIRLAELCGLTMDDAALSTQITEDSGDLGNIRVAGCGRSEWVVALNWKACEALQAYPLMRRASDDPHLFLTKFGTGMSPRSVEYLVAKYIDQAGIRNASVQTLRHKFATHHVRRGSRLEVVRVRSDEEVIPSGRAPQAARSFMTPLVCRFARCE